MTTAERLPAAPQAGSTLGRYTVERTETLPEMQGTLVLLRHENGARHAHIIRDDENAAFGVTFPTVPKDSTGIAHILEHLVLMGSQKYPVRDPFFAMLPRSLNTFMNAMTYPAWTTYPFSTRNEKDYFNLLGVYLDATFFPLMRYESFRQDGHRFEYATPDDPKTELKLQGVVYNEMKGAMATPSSVLFRALGKALYPDLTYANNSGGAPENIPSLTHEDLRNFHAAHYHPSNAYFYTYGKLPLDRILQVIEEHVMSRMTPNTLDVSIPDQTSFTEPHRETVTYPSSDTERGAQVLVAWKFGLSSDADANLRNRILGDVLLGNPGAPLTRPLIESGLGSAMSDATGYQDIFREGAFTVGLKGLPAGKMNEVETLVLDTLRGIAENGIEPELIESSLHQFELAQKEVSNARFPFALSPMFSMMGFWVNGGDPASGLRLDAPMQRLRDDLAKNPRVFEDLIRTQLLDNPHRVTLELAPDPDLAARTEADEKALVQRLSKDFTDEDRARIVKESQTLKELQATPYDPSSLPTLALSDVPTTVPRVEYSKDDSGRATVGRAAQPTGGLTYLDVQVKLPEVPADLLDTLPLYAFAVTRGGAADMDYVALARRIEAVTGGVSASVGTATTPTDLNTLRLNLTFAGKALARNGDALVGVLRDIIAQPKFTRERLEQLLKQRLAGMKAGVVSAGHMYALRLAASQVNPGSALQERFEGLTALNTLKGIVEEGGLDALLERLNRIRDLILSGKPVLLVTATPDDVNLNVQPITGLFTGDAEPHHPSVQPTPHTPQARTTDSPVAFNAVAWQTVPYTHPDSPALLALSQLLRTEYLLKELREKGGAYGGFATFSPRDGVFAMISYRDPHIRRTFETYRAARAFLNTELGQRELTEAILSASTALDPLTSPDTIGRMRYYGDLAGYTPEVLETYKARLLATTLGDLKRVMDTWLTPDRAAYALVSGRDPNEEMKDLNLNFDVQAI